VQRLLNGAPWDADKVRVDLRAYVIEYLGDPEAVLVIDETGFLKKGEKSVGVARQYLGTAGKVENCQIGVFLAYSTSHGRAFLDRALYLPEQESRREAAGVPEEVEFATKGELARKMIERALEAEVPASWVTADEVYGNDGALRRWLKARGRSYVLAVSPARTRSRRYYRGPDARRRSPPRRRRRPGNEWKWEQGARGCVSTTGRALACRT
jgi:SRSO17 transposase